METLLLLAGVNLLGAMSPGPDFVMVVKNAMTKGCLHGIATSAGIGTAIILHGLLVILGLGSIIMQSILIYSIIKIAGALYLLTLGIKMRRNKTAINPIQAAQADNKTPSDVSYLSAYREGFITNLLNPKFIVFLLALFAQFFGQLTTLPLQIAAAVTAGVTGAGRFMLLSGIIGIAPIQGFFLRQQQRINKLFGGMLMYLGIKIVMEKSS